MNILKALITSSEDSEKVSLTIKSVVALAVLFGLDQTVVNQAGNDFANLITGAGMVIASATTLWGLARKIVNRQWSA